VLLLREQGYTVEFDVSELVARVSTDPSQLMRIFENVVSNILKYADKSSPVSIIIDIAEEQFTLKIRNKIKENRDFAESNGIGLKTCHKIAETLGLEFSTVEDAEYFSVNITFTTAS
jgi:signal transduction histidine kinase